MIPYPLNGDIRSSADLTSLYRQYLRVLNNRTFDLLSRFVARRCMHNGHRMSSHEYSQLIKSGATFCADEIVADVSQRTIAARLHIEFLSSCTKAGSSKRSPINSHAHSPTRTCTTGPRHVTRLNEHVFYHFDENWRIDRVWSMLEDVSDHVNQLNSVSSGRDACEFPDPSWREGPRQMLERPKQAGRRSSNSASSEGRLKARFAPNITTDSGV